MIAETIKNTEPIEMPISKARKNELLAKYPGIQDVKLLNSALGEIIRTSEGEYILPNDDVVSGGTIHSIEETRCEPGIFQIYQKRRLSFYNSRERKLYGWFPFNKQTYLGFSVFLLQGDEAKEWYLVDLQSLKKTGSKRSFLYHEKVADGLFFLVDDKKEDGNKKGCFIDITVPNFKKSPSISNIKDYYVRDKNIICISTFGSIATLNLKKMKLSHWEFIE